MTGLLSIILSIVFCAGPTPVPPPAPHPQQPGSRLTFSLYPTTPAAGPLAVVTLTCNPPGGTHRDPAGTCAKLAAVDGDPAALTPRNGFCPEIFDPVLVTVRGNWGTRHVAFSHTYDNRCLAEDRSDGVFQF